MAEKKLLRASTPEEVGVSSAALAALMQDAIDNNLEWHSVMVVRHGKVAFETFRKPYSPNFPHVMFSVSKSVTSCAIGFAVEEGLLTVEDRVLDHVPEMREFAPDDPNLEALTVRNLLTMTAGKLVSPMADKGKKQWLKDYAEGKWSYPPGEGWNYSSESTYILCVIIKNVTGMGVVDYLMPRLFGPLGIPRPFWENDGCGVEAGGWGLYLTTESFAKIMTCYAQGGVFEGKQIIPARWVEASGYAQAPDSGHSSDDPHGTSGYGYCFWLNCVPGSYRADGVFSQMGFIFPEYDACMIITGGEVFTRKTKDCAFRHLPQLFESEEVLPAGEEIPLFTDYPVLAAAPRCAAMEESLEGRTALFPNTTQQLPKMAGFPVSIMPVAVFFMSADKAGGIDKLRFRFQEHTLKFSWNEGAERNTILCGMDGSARLCKVTLGGVDFTVNCSAAWEGTPDSPGGAKLHLWIRPVNSVAERRLTFSFKGRQVRMVPRTSPSLSTMAEYAAPHALNMIANPALGQFIANSMSTLIAGAEPTHFGYLK